MAYEAVAYMMVASIIGLSILATTTKNELTKIFLYVAVLFQIVIGLNIGIEIAGNETPAIADVVTNMEIAYSFMFWISISILLMVIITYIIFVMKALWPPDKSDFEKL